jgi:gliding motility-associated-like protein
VKKNSHRLKILQSLIVFLCLLIFTKVYSQNETNTWYFGHYGGLSFANGSPSILTNGQIHTDEGVASICDNSGNLLFYTDGVTVWNAQHQVMPNGNDLYGSFSSTQSAIIVPKLGDPLHFYVFTVDQLGLPHGLNYSIVNMALDNGMGDVEVKNIPLLTPVCEKITAVKHCNGRDIWVITHQWNSDAYYSYLVTSSGINSPVITHAGRVVTGGWECSIGYLKASPDGRRLAAAHNLLGLDLLDFDNSTGIVSNARSLFQSNDFYTHPYGVEFSPASKFLYTTVFYFDVVDLKEYNILLQYDVEQPTTAGIISSKKLIYRNDWIYQTFAALQMARDGKMYMAEFTFPNISVINDPDAPGTACNFVYHQIQFTMPGQTSRFGLPTFIQSYWQPQFTISGQCLGQQLYFYYTRPAGITSVKWDFGDPGTGVNNTSTLDTASHLFTSSGVYTVKLIRYSACGSDTTSKQVQVGQLNVNLGPDTIVCDTVSLLLNPGTTGNNSYVWQDSSASPVFLANHSGLYWVEVKSNESGCAKRDSVQLIFSNYPQFDLGNDIYKCEGDSVTLSPGVSNADYLWNTGDTTNILTIGTTGTYWVNISLDGCAKSDSVNAVFYPFPMVNLGNDTTLCENQTLLLDAGNAGAQFLWNNNSTSQIFLVNTKGQYMVRVTTNGCSTKDTIKISYDLKPVFTLGPDFSICSGTSTVLAPDIQNNPGLNYLWQNGNTTPTFTVTQPGLYSLRVFNYCGNKIDTVIVSQGVCKLYIPTAFSPNNDGLNDIFRAGFGENVTKFNMQIFNRWGQLVFDSKNINQGWNGSYSGLRQPIGEYVWIIRFKTPTSAKEQLIKGTVLLIR